MSTEQRQEETAPTQAVATLKQKQKNLDLLLEKFRGSIAQALPGHLTADRMIRVSLTAASKSPGLLDCTPHSLLASIITASQLGLMPDSILGECYFVPFNNFKKKIKECQIIIGYRGLCTLAMNSGKVKSVQARAVYAANDTSVDGEPGDFFEWELGLNEKLVHKPGSIKDDDHITHFYAIVKYTNGGHVMDVMTREQVNKIRDESANYKDAVEKDRRFDTSSNVAAQIWTKYFAEMGCKSVLRRLMKYVPLSPEIQRAVGLDEAADYGGQKLTVEILGEEATDEEMRDTIDAEIVAEDQYDKNEYTDSVKAEAAKKKKAAEDALQATLNLNK